MAKLKKLIIACDGESASGKSTAAKLVSKKYKLLLINSGLLYRYCSKLIIKDKPKNSNSVFKKVNLKQSLIKRLQSKSFIQRKSLIMLQSLAKNKKVREIVNQLQMKIIRANNRICVEGRDIASKILAKNPKYDLAFYFKCSLEVAAYRRWLDLKKSVPLNEVKRSLKIRTSLDKKRKNSPLIKVKDAILVRSDKLNKKEVLAKMSKAVEKVLKN